jgi:hypothetical protein
MRAEEPGYDTFLVPDHSEKDIAPIAVLRPKIAKKG